MKAPRHTMPRGFFVRDVLRVVGQGSPDALYAHTREP